MTIRNANFTGGQDFQDTGSAVLIQDINAGSTIMFVDDTSTFKSFGNIKLSDEIINYSGTSNGSAFNNLTRGAFFTTPAAHTSGTTGVEKEIWTSADINATFDAFFDLAISNPAFWLNGSTFDVYDDFESYATGSFSSNANWVVISGVPSISVTTDAGGTGQELKMSGSFSATTEVRTDSLAVDRHTHIKAFWNHSHSVGGASGATSEANLRIKMEGGSFIEIIDINTTDGRGAGNGDGLMDFKIVALGSDVYDVYAGGKKVISAITASPPRFYMRLSGSRATLGGTTLTLTIDDVTQSKVAVE